MEEKSRSKENYIVQEEDAGMRLDLLLNSLLSDYQLSRSRIQKLITEGQVRVNDLVVSKSSLKLNAEDQLHIDLSALSQKKELEPYQTDYEILHEDSDLLIVNKPAGLTVHPGAGNYNQTLANALCLHLGYAPYLVHRLDKDTSGLLVVAKNEQTQRALIDLFQERLIKREYLALCLVTPRANRRLQQEPSGRIETLIGRDERNRLKMSVGDNPQKGKTAITNWEVLESYNYALLVKFKLETGRTHQIRVHADYLGSPIIGDPTYGDFSLLPKDLLVVSQALNRQFLHAASLSFKHPYSAKKLVFQVDLPAELDECLKIFKNYST